MRILLFLILIPLIVSFSASAQETPRALPVSPAPKSAVTEKKLAANISDSSSTDTDNQHVWIYRFKIPPEGSLDLPKLEKEGLLLCLKGDLLRRIPEGGNGEPWEDGPGSALWNRGGTAYNLENHGPNAAELLLIELKDSYAITQIRVPYSERDPMLVDAPHFRIRFENEHVRVLQLHLKPRDGIDESQFASRLEIALGDFQANEESAGGKLIEVARSAGEAKWQEPQLKTIINAGEKPLDEVLVELKHPFCYKTEFGDEAMDKNPELKKYFSEVQSKVSKYWLKKMPAAVRDGDTGLLILRIKVQSDGSLLEDGISFQEVFASDLLVEKAMNAVRDAAPFPPLPKSLPSADSTVRSVFLYNLPTRPTAGCHE
jgi:hypothetical protein